MGVNATEGKFSYPDLDHPLSVGPHWDWENKGLDGRMAGGLTQMAPLLQSEVVIVGAISVVIRSRAVDMNDWDKLIRAIPELSGAPTCEIDVRIKAQDEDSAGMQFVWWRMLRALSEKLSTFVYANI